MRASAQLVSPRIASEEFPSAGTDREKGELVAAAASTLAAATRCAYAQGMALLRVASAEHLDARDPVVQRLAELALFSILFSDGMRLTLRELTAQWRLPARALMVALPLTLLGTALLAR